MSCPHCAVPLVMSEPARVEIDYYPTRRGIWLDRGEIDKILERVAGDVAPVAPQSQMPPQSPMAPQAPYLPQDGYDPRYGQGQHGHDLRYRHGKREKSWVEEIFD